MVSEQKIEVDKELAADSRQITPMQNDIWTKIGVWS